MPSINNRFDQSGGNVEVESSTSLPYNSRQWPSLHIGNDRDKHPGTGTKYARNNSTLNDPAQSGTKPTRNYYTNGPISNAETGIRQYYPGKHEMQLQSKVHPQPVKGNSIFHSYDAESSAPSFGHNALSKGGNKGKVIQQVSPGDTHPLHQFGSAESESKRASISIDQLREMYTLNESIPNFLVLDRTAKQNFMGDLSDIRKAVL